MAQFPRLSNREWEVVKHLLEGKSNKLIASSLGISDRTVEFHLRNIYAKFRVSSRIELILKLGNATGWLKSEKLGRSTVASKREVAENRDRLNSQLDWATSFRDTVSIIGKELEMKNLLLSKHVFVGMAVALLTGFLWIVILEYLGHLSAEDFTIFTLPLIIGLAINGLIVGATGKQRGETSLKVLLSVMLGTGSSPFVVIPLMMLIVISTGWFVTNFGITDLSAIPDNIAAMVAMGIMITLWLVASIALGFFLLSMSITITVKRQKMLNLK